jgi:glycosyltransferase involved in cell wall biosynthesis
MKGPLVSVVVPVYNGERFLGETLDSILAQDYEPIELIVVDDGSTDGSAGVARTFDGVRVVVQENQGPAAARNAGLSLTGGEFVAFVDSDDLLPPAKLSTQVTYLLEHPDAACVLGRQEWINPPPNLKRDLLYGELDGIPLTSALFRRAILRELDGYDSSYRSHENMDLLFRLRERGAEIAVLSDLVLYRRFHGGNLSHAPRAEADPRLRSLKAKLDRSRANAESS